MTKKLDIVKKQTYSCLALSAIDCESQKCNCNFNDVNICYEKEHKKRNIKEIKVEDHYFALAFRVVDELEYTSTASSRTVLHDLDELSFQ